MPDGSAATGAKRRGKWSLLGAGLRQIDHNAGEDPLREDHEFAVHKRGVHGFLFRYMPDFSFAPRSIDVVEVFYRFVVSVLTTIQQFTVVHKAVLDEWH